MARLTTPEILFPARAAPSSSRSFHRPDPPTACHSTLIYRFNLSLITVRRLALQVRSTTQQTLTCTTNFYKMSAFIEELWTTITTPGTSPALVKATHGAFAGLLLVLVFCFTVTRNKHFAFLFIIASCLWAAVTWFINEIELEKARLQAEGKWDDKKGKVDAVETEKVAEKPAAVKSTGAASPTGSKQTKSRKI